MYLCPDCGSANDNQPLKGVLKIVYDFSTLKKKLSREIFLQLIPGRPWLYPELWPFRDMKSIIHQPVLERLILPAHSVFQINVDGRSVLILDETRNPTFSYKDRASIIVALKAIESGVSELSVASTGNAGSSLAGIASRLGLVANIWVPDIIPPQKLLQIQAYGARVHLVDGSYDNAFDLNRRVSASCKWYDRNTAYNPLTIEGKKSAAYDIFISLRGRLPGNIIIPVGDGAIIGGIYKGFSELLSLGWIDRLPRLIAVQASGSDALFRYINIQKFEYLPPKTIADGICAGAPRNLYMASTAVKESHGLVIRVSDAEILDAQKELACHQGYLVEPAAAASLAGWRKLISNHQTGPDHKSLLLLTGNGLKDTESVRNWIKPLKAKSIDEWKEYYSIN